MAVSDDTIHLKLAEAQKGILDYLERAKDKKRIDQQQYEEASVNTLANLKTWLENERIDAISPRLKEGIRTAIDDGSQWEQIVNAFRQQVRFGTGGIRGMMAFDKHSITLLDDKNPEVGIGIDAPILKGTNTINDLVFLLTSAGVARFGKDQTPPFEKIVIGYDSRILGNTLSAIVAQLFLAYGYTVYLFDAPCPYPEVTFAIPDLKADVGILISASHNDYRYNGYKLSCCNGSQFDPEERDAMYNQYIARTTPAEIKPDSFESAKRGQFDQGEGELWFLGGEEPEAGFDYGGREDRIINIHKRHRDHVKRFLLTPDLAKQQKSSADPLTIGYCAFHGAGRIAVPRLLKEVGFTDIKSITHNGLNDLNGLFPSFNSEPGREQQPDPGDPRAAKIAVDAFQADYPGEFAKTDIIIGTDPDADRTGIVVKVPSEQRHLCGGNDYVLLPADDAWALVLWYRLQKEIENHGAVQEAEKKFIVLSHTTSDSIVRLARKHKIGVVKTWVGFAALAAATRDVWDGKVDTILPVEEGRGNNPSLEYVRNELCHPFVHSCQDMHGMRSINLGAMEQSNGFSILGGPPPDKRSLGVNGHVRDKDGTFAALLLAEIAAWAKQQKTTLFELLDKHIYLDPDIGLFVNLYEPDPLDGEYPGIEGDRLKKTILTRALESYQAALQGSLQIGGHPVTSVCIYRTGKYDAIYPPSKEYQFPDEGVRFFFDKEKLDHVTVRPSGTGNSLRFHVQVHAPATETDLIARKEQLRKKGKEIMDGIRKLLGAPRT